MRSLINNSHAQKQPAGGNAVIDHLQDRPFNPLRIQRKNPERDKPHMTDTGIRNKLLEVRLRKSHVRAIDDGDNRQRHNDRSEGDRGIR